MTKQVFVSSEDQMIALGKKLGQSLRGGEVVQLISDLGGGKTTLTKGIAAGIGYGGDVASPSFTVSREYQGRSLTLHHYDFYRLDEIGLMSEELREVLMDDTSVCVIEWAKDAARLFPADRLLTITIERVPNDENARTLTIDASEELVFASETTQ